jgi:hypothetical protein
LAILLILLILLDLPDFSEPAARDVVPFRTSDARFFSAIVTLPPLWDFFQRRLW